MGLESHDGDVLELEFILREDLLVDKDRNPKWAFNSISDVDFEWMGKILV